MASWLVRSTPDREVLLLSTLSADVQMKWYIYIIYNFFPISTVQALKLTDECGTIRNSSVALKRWLLMKPKLL